MNNFVDGATSIFILKTKTEIKEPEALEIDLSESLCQKSFERFNSCMNKYIGREIGKIEQKT